MRALDIQRADRHPHVAPECTPRARDPSAVRVVVWGHDGLGYDRHAVHHPDHPCHHRTGPVHPRPARRLTRPLEVEQELSHVAQPFLASEHAPRWTPRRFRCRALSEVSDVIVTALDTAGDAATVVVASARRRPAMAIGVGVAAAALALLALMLVRRRRHRSSSRGAIRADAPHRRRLTATAASGLSSERVIVDLTSRAAGTVVPARQYDAGHDGPARANAPVCVSESVCSAASSWRSSCSPSDLSALMVRSWDRAARRSRSAASRRRRGVRPAACLQRPGDRHPWITCWPTIRASSSRIGEGVALAAVDAATAASAHGHRRDRPRPPDRPRRTRPPTSGVRRCRATRSIADPSTARRAARAGALRRRAGRARKRSTRWSPVSSSA